MLRTTLLLAFSGLLTFASPAQAQFDQTLEQVFDRILRENFQLSPGPHADHYLPAADVATSALTPALSALISSNVSSFPLSATIGGVTFDFSTGQPVSVVESQGPIFAEIAETLGERKLNVGFNTTYLDLNRFRGMPLREIQFTFPHEDLGEPGLGDNPSEVDLVHVALGLDVDATIFAFSATYGVTSNFDVGLAVPFINLNMRGTARAVVESYTLFVQDEFGGGARHFFDGTPQNPDLEDDIPYEEHATGIGDIALRFKYRIPARMAFAGAALFDVRLPTGDPKNFLGTGRENIRVSVIGSKRMGTFTPHLNAGYMYRGAEQDSDELELIAGFDQKVARGLTFAFDVLGAFDLQSDEAIRLYDAATGPTTMLHPQSPDPPLGTGASATRSVPLSNVPNWNYDHRLDASAGFRYAPSERFQLLANVLIPLQEGGLRSSIAPTIGFSLNP